MKIEVGGEYIDANDRRVRITSQTARGVSLGYAVRDGAYVGFTRSFDKDGKPHIAEDADDVALVRRA